ncbi:MULTISPECIES: RNA polymerase factor sigma-54 [unclassified Chelatococcus]|uniref:RNA polymerase factor sigma-54 n=1 Tax=unclassified Chelatococcus TaxID=2638111 RepID=UPI001BCD517F|nr:MULTISPECIES: RNA polymerase factor sigma-54 [unclassified Chelatococcus]MBS7740942.1 RNA polymerase factor sigma-54 [Chelatococcus sp. HY11]MBX3546767.1 RNA polymerase factor sigma-54 [Chelatococcus sp.]MCO5077760.1 RNA polymerase factor sigma-54 [Chelatococcus sp.]
MALSHRLELRQGQSLVMTPQLLQAIKLLQLSHFELMAHVEAELETNPLLERGGDVADGFDGADERHADAHEPAPPASFDTPLDPADWSQPDGGLQRETIEADFGTTFDNVFQDEAPLRAAEAAGGSELPVSSSLWSGVGGGGFDDDMDFAATLVADETLHGHLEAQLDLATTDPVTQLIGRFLIDAIDEAGYLAEDLAVIADRLDVGVSRVELVLKLVQSFEPSGVGARSLAECLAIQLRELDRFDPAMEALVANLPLVARRDFQALKRICGVDDEDLADMLAEVRQLDPKPGRAFGSTPVQPLVPDVFVRTAPDGSWLIDLNPETLPRVLVNQTYHAKVARHARNDTEKAYIADCLQNATWLQRSLEQRAKTILKVASEIVRQQDGFFAYGAEHLRPLNLKTVADAIGLHESTVSRVTSNKAIGTSRGVFAMKYFFSAAIAGVTGAESHSAEAVRHRIKQMIDQETPRDILSDDAIVQKLRDSGIDIARRTVAKYRESLRIPSSVERRRMHQRA